MTTPANAPRYEAARWTFFRFLGASCAAAFLSLLVQVRGLVGEHGILPAAEFLARAREILGAGVIARLPTLLWLDAGDRALTALCVLGLVASALLACEVLEGPALVAIWLAYLSLAVGGQTFLSFQWDALLLESVATALFWVAWRVSFQPAPTREWAPGRWLVASVAGKLMFLSGATKLASGDSTWRDLTAMTYHYETQPLPGPASWFMHHLPLAAHRLEALGTFAIEMGLPLLLLVPCKRRALRRIAGAGFVGLQLLIGATGNYGFFNLLAITLALPLVDDDLWRRILPRRLFAHATRTRETPDRRGAARWIRAGLAAAVALVSLTAATAELQATAGRSLPAAERAILAAVEPLRSINGYGLFRVMTTERPTVVLEASADGATWREVPWRYQTLAVDRRPPCVPLHMPRLDWQLWFAGLDPRGASHWLVPFLRRTLEASPDVLALLPPGALVSAPPRFVRLKLYRYRFTTPAERRATGAWWSREAQGDLTPALELADLAR